LPRGKCAASKSLIAVTPPFLFADLVANRAHRRRWKRAPHRRLIGEQMP
jgi:hypothetical protein